MNIGFDAKRYFHNQSGLGNYSRDLVNSLIRLHPNNKYYLFGKEGGIKLASEYDLSFLGQIPLIQSIREGGDEGLPAMVGEDAITKDAFRSFVGQAVRQIAIRNAQLPKTETITVTS